ncbi:MAG: NADH-quinone oxidoreductase subunit J, partial [Alphaproteobacteria bacterium]|nr:NADH-quinone oxidoreductase subunit J [Alphaproteobacteria bacterium]
VLYTQYVYPFQIAGLILLVAMIGAIVLALRHGADARRQRIASQVSRARKDAIAVVQVPTGQGVG